MRQSTTIPIPRKGIYWSVQKLMPPQFDEEEEVYYLWPPVVEGEMEAPDELAIFENALQAIVSVWLVGFSYSQMLVLFPEYTNVAGIRNKILPTIGDLGNTKQQLIDHPPRQLVDIEYLDIVGVVGVPAGKINRQVYIDYMAWLQGGKSFWLHEKVREGSSKIKARIEKKKAAQKKLQYEIDSLEEKLMATTVGY